MKKEMIKKILGAFTIVLILVNCAPIEYDTEILDEALLARKNITEAKAKYSGTTKEGDDIYSFRLMTEGMDIDYEFSSGAIKEKSYKGDGYAIYFNIIVDDADDIFVPTGTFDVKDADNMYYAVIYNGSAVSSVEKIKFSEGKIDINESGNNYTISIDATNNIGTKLVVNYTGEMVFEPEIEYANEPLQASQEVFEIESFSFETENEDMDRDGEMDLSLGILTLTGEKGIIVIDEIVGPKYPIGKEPKYVPAGTYELTEWTYDEDSFTPGEIYNGRISGSYAYLLEDAEANTFTSVWYFTDAQMTVTESSNEYSISIEATSAYGTKISAKYTETITE